MKKVYYLAMAIAMAFIMLIFSPVKTYAAGSYISSTVDVNSNVRGMASCNSYMMPTIDEDDDTTSNTVIFDCSVALRNQRLANTSAATSMYCSGYLLWSCTVSFTMNSALSSSWRFTYDITYGETPEGVYCTVPVVNSGQNSIIIYFYTYMDNAAFANTASIISSATVNLHISAYTVAGSAINPAITVSSLNLVSQGASATFTNDPTWATGQAYVDFWTMVNAIQTSVGDDINAIVAYLLSIKTLFPQYMDNILSQLAQDYQLLLSVTNTLTSMKVQDSVFYHNIMDYLEYIGQSQATEMASEKESAIQEIEMVESQLHIDAPTIDSELGQLDTIVGQADTTRPFFWLSGSSVLVTLLIVTLLFGIVGYVLHGNE